eukprot:CAMPEP_0198257460 /NCGR_PEP_ID=MMETSP1447-20131203/7147_1 /TAXON_ID=420782 /ORGANISM="Chaetoceros dichaeta, Strain CCMP1751" /LENGTH=279 /DNA_ID=CAMNT_0043944379 /DNA_START=158 /DNA_END=997 /DNA_ORIENTATION=-
MPRSSTSFTITTPTTTTTTPTPTKTTRLQMANKYGRSTPRYTKNIDRTKRQERVGQVIRSEIATVLQNGYVKNTDGRELEDALRRRINVVNADVSPDLRQARITVSIMKPHVVRDADVVAEEEEEEEFEEEEDEDEEDADEEEYDEYDDEFEDYTISSNTSGDAVVDRRRAYAWLVKNSKQIRHSIAQRLSHMKSVPQLSFVQVDVGAAVDVMNLIDKVSKENYKREVVGVYGQNDDELPKGMYLESEEGGEDEDNWDDEEDWEDEEEEEGVIDSIEDL